MQWRYEQRWRGLREALISAGYPRPVVGDEPGQLTLSWGTGVGVREMCVSPSGVVARTPDAVFALGLLRQSAADWVSPLHPLIAEPIVRTSESPFRVVEPVTNIVRSASVIRRSMTCQVSFLGCQCAALYASSMSVGMRPRSPIS